MPTPSPGSRRTPYLDVRSVLETPILDDRKWAKVPSVPADVLLIDLEDAVPPTLKLAAREVVARAVADPGASGVGDKIPLARPNHLDSPWGRDDVIALARAGVKTMAYPKITSADDLLAVIALLNEHGADPDIFAIIETTGAVMELREITRIPQVVALMYGPGDLSVEMDVPVLQEDGRLNPLFDTGKHLCTMAATAAGIASIDIVYQPDLRDLEELRRRASYSRQLGFTALATFYPPHVAVINDVLTPSADQVAAASALIATYEQATAAGFPAVLDAEGRTILVHDYEKARAVLRKAR